MQKNDFGTSNNLLLKYILKVVITTILAILLFTYFFSKISYMLDLDMKYNSILSVIICALCAAITSYVAVYGIKNNGLLLGAVAQVPLLFYSLLNVIFNENTLVLFLIKAFIVICVGMLMGLLANKKSSKLRLR